MVYWRICGAPSMKKEKTSLLTWSDVDLTPSVCVCPLIDHCNRWMKMHTEVTLLHNSSYTEFPGWYFSECVLMSDLGVPWNALTYISWNPFEGKHSCWKEKICDLRNSMQRFKEDNKRITDEFYLFLRYFYFFVLILIYVCMYYLQYERPCCIEYNIRVQYNTDTNSVKYLWYEWM